MKSCLQWIALGFGLAAGGGLAYALITDQMTRTVFFLMLMFIVGGFIVGGFLVLDRYGQARAASAGQQRTTINYPGQLPGPQPPRWDGYPPALPEMPQFQQLPAGQPRRQWSNLPAGEVLENDDQFVA